MNSALESHPRLRDDLTIVRRETHGKVHYVVKQPEEQKYYRFGELEVQLMKLMDGQRTPDEIADAAEQATGVRPKAGNVADFAHKLKRLGLVERTPAERHLMLMEHIRSQRKVRANRRTQGSILRLRFSIGDPDALFDRIVGRIGWMWSPAFVWATSALFAVYLGIMVARWEDLWNGMAGLYTLSGFTLWDWVLLYAIFLVIGGIHELGHGLTTKYFGGEVHEIGAMLLYFSPALFCNTNDAWTFEKRSRRLWVTFAGPWIQLVIAALAAIVWIVTQPDTFIHHLAFLCVLMGGVAAVLANANPLIPLDGYYALSDWLEIPNLRGRAFAYWGWLIRRYVLGIDAEAPPTTPRERRVFLLYGALAFLYSIFVIVVSLLWLILIAGRFIGPWVWVILALIAVKLISRVSGRWRAVGLAAATSWRAGFLRGGRAGFALVGLAILLALPFVLPWTFRAEGHFRVEAAERAPLRAGAAGVLDALYVREGDTVSAGDVVARLWNPDLEARFLGLRARAESLRLTRAAAETRGDRADAARAAAELGEVVEELAALESQRARLTVRAPIDGLVLGHRLHERLGEALQPGALLFEVGSVDGRYARVRLPPQEAGEVAAGQWANLKFSTKPGLKFRSQVSSVAPAAQDGWLEAEIRLPASGWQPAPGMAGVAKIATRRTNIAGAIARVVRRTIRIDLWL